MKIIDNINTRVLDDLEKTITKVLQTATTDETLAESVARDEKRLALEKQIAVLKTKMRREKQFNRQMEMNAELKKLKKELEDNTNG